MLSFFGQLCHTNRLCAFYFLFLPFEINYSPYNSPFSSVVITDTILMHDEAANLLVWYLNNNLFSAEVSDRVFWAIPGTVAAVTVPMHATSLISASTSGGSSSSNIIVVAVAAVGVCFVLALAILIVRRRRRIAVERNDVTSKSKDPNMHFTNRRGSVRYNFPNIVTLEYYKVLLYS